MYDELKTDKSLLGWFSLWGHRFQVRIFIPARLRCSSGLLHPVIGLPPPIRVSEIFLWPLQTCCQCFLHIWRSPLWAWTSPQGWSCLGWILQVFPYLSEVPFQISSYTFWTILWLIVPEIPSQTYWIVILDKIVFEQGLLVWKC